MKTELNIYQKLFNAKKEIGKLTKDSKNPFFKSSYLSLNGLLEAVEDVLVKHDLLLLQPIEQGAVKTVIIDVDSTKDNVVESYLMLPNITDPQKILACITYYRRGTLISLLGLQAEDDDGNTASAPTEEKDNKAWLNVGSKEWDGALTKGSSLTDLRKYFKISKANAEQYEQALKGK